MMIRTFFSHIWESLKSLKRNGLMSVASIFTVMITLSLASLFVALTWNVTKIVTDLENSVTVEVYANVGSTATDIAVLQNNLKKDPDVTKVDFQSKEVEFQEVNSILKRDGGVELDGNPLYDKLIVSVKKPELTKSAAERFKKLNLVDKVTYNYGINNPDNLISLMDHIKKIGFIIGGVLLAAAIFLISNAIRVTIFSRKREIGIMRLVGAKNGFIRLPFFFEGAWIGLLGAIIPVILTYVGYRLFYYSAVKSLHGGLSNISFVAPHQFILLVSIGVVSGGVLIGSLGSMFAMRKFLKI